MPDQLVNALDRATFEKIYSPDFLRSSESIQPRYVEAQSALTTLSAARSLGLCHSNERLDTR